MTTAEPVTAAQPARVAVVTGTAHGIGAAIADSLQAGGAIVHRVDKDTADLTDSAAAGGFFAGLERVDILVNNAGGVCGQTGRPLEEVPDLDWAEVVNANLTTAFHCTKAVVGYDPLVPLNETSVVRTPVLVILKTVPLPPFVPPISVVP